MTIDREIIRDLLPLCQSGLASPASRQLVETWLQDHPGELTDFTQPLVEAGITAEVLARARRLRRWLRWLFGLAIGLTVLSCAAELKFADGGLVSARLLALDQPLAFAPVIAAASACWCAYFWLKSRLR